ncbi:MAG: CynX/NimT family MFS transporter [Coriobacteriales bacterium]
MQEEKLYPRRWAVLVGMTCILIAIQFSVILPGGAAILVMQKYGIEPMMFSMIMTAPYLTGFLFAIPAGVLADRIGLNKVLLGGYFLALIGVAIRIVSGTSFAILMVGTVVMGCAPAALNANSAKLLRIWFPGKANSFAMGVYTAGMSFGAALALFYGSHIATIDEGWIFSTALVAFGIVMWLVLYRNHPEGDDTDKEPIKEYLGVVLRNKDVWGISIFAFLVFGGISNPNSSFMVAAITTLAGDPSYAAEAGNLSTLNTIIAATLSMIFPVVFVARFKSMRTPTAICCFACAILYAVIYFIPYGPATWILYILQAIFFCSLMPITKMLPALLPSVKREHLGVVGGVQATFQNFGMFLIASYVLSPIVIAVTGQTDGLGFYQGMYIGIAIICVLSFFSMFLFSNVRSNVADKIADDKAAAEKAAAEK